MPTDTVIIGFVVSHVFVIFIFLLKILKLSNLLSYITLIGLSFGIFWMVSYLRKDIQKIIQKPKAKYIYLCFVIGAVVFFILRKYVIPARFVNEQLIVLGALNPITLPLEIMGVAIFYFLLKKYADRIPFWGLVLPLAGIAGWLTYSPYHLDLYHHSAHFVSVSKVMAGIPFSEGFRSLYGHFAFFFKPFFMVFPFNQENYDILLSLLICWSFINFSLVIDKVVDHKFYKYIGIFMLFGFATLFNRRGVPNSHVLIPLRAIFPSLLLLWTASWDSKKKLYWISGLVLCAFSIIFNAETGIFCLISFTAFYAYKRSFSNQNIVKIGVESSVLALAGLAFSLIVYNMLNILQGGGVQNLKDLLYPLLIEKSLVPFLQLPLVFKEFFWIFMLVLFFFAGLYVLGKSPLFNPYAPVHGQDNPINDIMLPTGLSGLFIFSYYMNRAWTYGAAIAACQATIILVWILSKMQDFSSYVKATPPHGCPPSSLMIPAMKKVGTIACIFCIVSIFSDAVYSKNFYSYLKNKTVPQPTIETYAKFLKKHLVGSQTSAAFGSDFWEYAYAKLGKKHLLKISDYSNWFVIYSDVYHNNPIDILAKMNPQQLFVTDNNFSGFGAYGVLSSAEDRQIAEYMTHKFNGFLQDYTLVSQESGMKYYKQKDISDHPLGDEK